MKETETYVGPQVYPNKQIRGMQSTSANRDDREKKTKTKTEWLTIRRILTITVIDG